MELALHSLCHLHKGRGCEWIGPQWGEAAGRTPAHELVKEWGSQQLRHWWCSCSLVGEHFCQGLVDRIAN
jgi:hypothetical protein